MADSSMVWLSAWMVWPILILGNRHGMLVMPLRTRRLGGLLRTALSHAYPFAVTWWRSQSAFSAASVNMGQSLIVVVTSVCHVFWPNASEPEAQSSLANPEKPQHSAKMR